MKFDELSPEEISFVYLLAEDMLDAFNEVLDNKGITYVMDSPLGKVEIFKEFSDDDLDTIKNSLKIQLLTSITTKFKPVIDLIGEENSDIIDNVREALFPKLDDDESKDEDL